MAKKYQVRFSKQFKKQFLALSPKQQDQFELRLNIWMENPREPLLRVHRLKGKLSEFYSMNDSGDLRALYQTNGHTAVFEMIGSHSQLYG